MDIADMLDRYYLIKRGIILRYGPRDNMTDCESDIILIYVPSACGERFHGTLYDEEFQKKIKEWILKHNKINKSELNNIEEILSAIYDPLNNFLIKGL
jgi:hypothetical protein